MSHPICLKHLEKDQNLKTGGDNTNNNGGNNNDDNEIQKDAIDSVLHTTLS